MNTPACRLCQAPLGQVFADLGMSPLANAFLDQAHLRSMEPFYPLRAYFCPQCLLVQLEAFQSPEAIFSEYAYFSSFSESWLRHAQDYCRMAADRFGLDGGSFVVEVASNDGYLLRHFLDMAIPCLGIEPAANVAREATDRGIPTLNRFFTTATAGELRSQGRTADLIVANNVLAHVPDLNDFIAGLAILLKPEGALTIEFPHLVPLVQDVLFDTIYHEHFSYFSLHSALNALVRHGLRVFDVERLPTHGGSLRVHACHEQAAFSEGDAVAAQLAIERDLGLGAPAVYLDFPRRVRLAKRNILRFCLEAKEAGKRLVGYGAPAKGNTLLNACGLGGDFLDYVVDRSPHKQGLYLPGTHLPVRPVEEVRRTRPDILVIMPWNLRQEIVAQMGFIREWGGQFAVLVPEPEVF